jgi:hypothetical protein
LNFKLLYLIATVIDACDYQPDKGPGRPPTETVRVVATLRRFLREGTPWRSLTANEDQASGSTLRRLLVLGVTAVIRHSRAKVGENWLRYLLERRPTMVAAVAQANKTARIVWALLARGESYHPPAAARPAAA